MRGGTSRGLIFRREDMPAAREDWTPIITAAMGSPDPNARQLDGMGAGYSSVSKICVVGPTEHPDADVEFTFGQVLVDRDDVDYGANCGNMSSAIGPFALEEGYVAGPRDGEALVRICNTNTGKIVHSRFTMRDGEAEVDGDLELDGVAGSGSPIRLDFLDPGGSGTSAILPTGSAVDKLTLPDGEVIAASLVDIALPMVFVRASDLGLTGTELPDAIEATPGLMTKLEAIHRAGAVAMGMAANLEAAARTGAAPKVAFLSPPAHSSTISARELSAAEMDLTVRMISMERAHKASPLTGALCLAAAMRIPGTIPHEAARKTDGDISRIGHPSGVVHVGADVREEDGHPQVGYVSVYRTARRLMEGTVFYRQR